MRCADSSRVKSSLVRRLAGTASAGLALAMVAGPASAGLFSDEPAAAAAPARPLMLDRPSARLPGADRQLLLGVARAGTRLVAVGANGHVVLSDDQGRSWRQAKNVPTSATLTAVRFASAQQGWAVGHLGVVLSTQDGGETWTRRLDGIQAAALALKAVQARAEHDTSDEMRMQLKLAQLAVSDGPNKPFLGVVTDRPEHAVVFGSFGLAFETNDIGKTWVALSDRLDNPRGRHYYGLARSSEASVMVGEQGLILRSVDGQRFVSEASPYEGTLFGVVAGAGDDVVAYGLRGNVLHSGDRGATWSKVDSGVPASIQAGVVMPSGAILLASESGQVVRSEDGGRSFRLLPHHVEPAADLLPLNETSVLVVGLRGAERLELNAAKVSK